MYFDYVFFNYFNYVLNETALKMAKTMNNFTPLGRPLRKVFDGMYCGVEYKKKNLALEKMCWFNCSLSIFY